MDMGISGRKAIVCASSRGLGKGCAMRLAQAGCEVIVNGRDGATLEATAAEIAGATGASVIAVVADVSTAEGQAALLAACPQPDILVNNNVGPPRRDYRELSRADMIAGLVANMITPIELIQEVAPGMAARKFGRIVNITSLSVYTPVSGLELSSGSRAGLTSFLGGVARLHAADNVTINNLLPGKFETDRLAGGFDYASRTLGITLEEAREREIRPIPAQRFGYADEFGAFCAFLCSVHAGYMTGRNILMDGGLNPSAF